jgi:hypothetical protein
MRGESRSVKRRVSVWMVVRSVSENRSAAFLVNFRRFEYAGENVSVASNGNLTTVNLVVRCSSK